MNQSAPVDLEAVEAASRQLLDDRMESVRTLAKARQDVHDHTAALRDAESTDKDAYDAAVKAGWSAGELRKVGLAPLTKSGTTPRSTTSRGASRRRTTNDPTTDTEGSSVSDTAGSTASPGESPSESPGGAPDESGSQS